MDNIVPRVVAGEPCNIKTSPTCSSVVNNVPVPVTFALPFVKETVPVRLAIHVEAELQLYVAPPATLVVTVADEAKLKVKTIIMANDKILVKKYRKDLFIKKFPFDYEICDIILILKL